jgi:5'-3' exonuclease
MNNLSPTTLLVDGEFFLHRVMHIPEIADMRTSVGKLSGGIYGVISSIHTTLLRFPGIRRCIVVFDSGRSPRRMKIWPNYKGNRKPKEGEEIAAEQFRAAFLSQKEVLIPAIPHFGMRLAILPLKEGDDILGWFAKQAQGDIVIATEDKDSFQLIHRNVSVYRPIKNEFVCLENFRQVVGVPKQLFLLKKAIMGDTSDNIPGVPKAGEVTVSRLMEASEQLLFNQGSVRLRDLLVESCKIQMEADSRGKSRYASVVENLSVVERNLDLMDLRREPFTPEEETHLRSVLDSSAGCFNEMESLKFLHTCEFRSFTDVWADFSKPFRVLR